MMPLLAEQQVVGLVIQPRLHHQVRLHPLDSRISRVPHSLFEHKLRRAIGQGQEMLRAIDEQRSRPRPVFSEVARRVHPRLESHDELGRHRGAQAGFSIQEERIDHLHVGRGRRGPTHRLWRIKLHQPTREHPFRPAANRQPGRAAGRGQHGLRLRPLAQRGHPATRLPQQDALARAGGRAIARIHGRGRQRPGFVPQFGGPRGGGEDSEQQGGR